MKLRYIFSALLLMGCAPGAFAATCYTIHQVTPPPNLSCTTDNGNFVCQNPLITGGQEYAPSMSWQGTQHPHDGVFTLIPAATQITTSTLSLSYRNTQGDKLQLVWSLYLGDNPTQPEEITCIAVPSTSGCPTSHPAPASISCTNTQGHVTCEDAAIAGLAPHLDIQNPPSGTTTYYATSVHSMSYAKPAQLSALYANGTQHLSLAWSWDSTLGNKVGNASLCVPAQGSQE